MKRTEQIKLDLETLRSLLISKLSITVLVKHDCGWIGVGWGVRVEKMEMLARRNLSQEFGFEGDRI